MTIASPAAAALTLEGVTKRFRNGVIAVNDLSLSLGTGVLALLGPNGAGKTTLMQMIATITKPPAGRIRFGNIDISRDPDVLRPRSSSSPTSRRSRAFTIALG